MAPLAATAKVRALTKKLAVADPLRKYGSVFQGLVVHRQRRRGSSG
jgi:hypothetical protein